MLPTKNNFQAKLVLSKIGVCGAYTLKTVYFLTPSGPKFLGTSRSQFSSCIQLYIYINYRENA